MTPEQKTFLLSLLSQINIKAADPDAVKNIEMIQSIVKELQ